MDNLRQYNIAYLGLKNGNHSFDFELDTKFLNAFDGEQLGLFGLDAKVHLVVEKKTNMMLLDFEIKGQVLVECDLCLNSFHIPLDYRDELVVRFGDENDDQQGDEIVLGVKEDMLNVAQFMFEYINFGLPYQRNHPNDPQGHPTCDPEMLTKLNDFLVTDDQPNEDPRWEALRKLKGN